MKDIIIGSVFLFLINVGGVCHLNAQSASFIELENKAKSGKVYDMAMLAYKYGEGKDVDRNAEKACYWYQQAVDKGFVAAMYNLARHYLDGDGVPKDTLMAESLYQKAADRGMVKAQLQLGHLAFRLHGREQAMGLFSEAAEKGNYIAMKTLSMFYSISVSPEERKEARKWLEKMEGSDDVDVFLRLAASYEYGFDLTGQDDEGKDLKKSLLYHQKAWLNTPNDHTEKELFRVYKQLWEQLKLEASLGVGQAMYHVGFAAQYGLSEQNFETAKEWYEKAAERGVFQAMDQLAKMYDQGSGVPKDTAMAMQWYLQAATSGSTHAMGVLADRYKFGRGVEKNMETAFYWTEKVAESGNAAAMNILAAYYLTGTGCGQVDYEKAVEWFEKSARTGNSEGERGLVIAKYDWANMLYKEQHDYARALPLLEDAANDTTRPSSGAMRLLSAYYRYGLAGLSVDEKMASYWLNKAMEWDDPQAMDMIKHINH